VSNISHPTPGTPKGNEQQIAGVNAYVSLPTSGITPRASLLVIADIAGWEFPNSRLICDEYAEKGFKVYMPDFFNGDALPDWTVPSLAVSIACFSYHG